jgi:hypothetical protein
MDQAAGIAVRRRPKVKLRAGAEVDPGTPSAPARASCPNLG